MSVGRIRLPCDAYPVDFVKKFIFKNTSFIGVPYQFWNRFIPGYEIWSFNDDWVQ